ncbi:rad51 domain protein [Shewanella decolorationis S12]|uniref:Rad51 domain protein n=2 Tax=Shewanella decolorationis TaxID=256839 RepID=A0ABN0PSW9_9GAMM|nr:rad51 domain protein [Shewanella decolorationis S12]
MMGLFVSAISGYACHHSRMSLSPSNKGVFVMGFNEQEKQALLAVKGVGPTVIKRFEEIGISSLAQLAEHEVEDIANLVASMLRTTCWKNSPQARNAIAAAIELARRT